MTRAYNTATTQQNTGGAVPAFLAGKNKIINGDFGVWQRGTSFTNPTSGAYNTDRFLCDYDGTGGTKIISQQTFTPGTAPVAGYEGTYFLRMNQSVAGTGATYNIISTKIEDVRTFAGQTITLSFWVKAATASGGVTPSIHRNYGSGGSATDYNVVSFTNVNFTTGWVRYSGTVTMPSVTGKTIGTGSYLQLNFPLAVNTVMTVDFWGLQLEAGSVATAFQTATGTIQGELAACQRYYEQSYDAGTTAGTNTTTGIWMGTLATISGSGNFSRIMYKVTKRSAATITAYTASGTSGSWIAFNSSGGQTSRTYTGSVSDTSGFTGYLNSATELYAQGHWTANSEL
jgi:hypothetical protein